MRKVCITFNLKKFIIKYIFFILFLCCIFYHGLQAEAKRVFVDQFPGMQSAPHKHRDVLAFSTNQLPGTVTSQDFDIVFMRKTKDGWKQYSLLPESVMKLLNTQYDEVTPYLDLDHHRIFFSSDRPVSGSARKNFNIFMIEKKKNGEWTLKNLSQLINSDRDEFYPAFDNFSNSLTFTRTDVSGIQRVYISRMEKGNFTGPELIFANLDDVSCFRPVEKNKYLYAARVEGEGWNLYLVSKVSGKFVDAMSLSVNSEFDEFCGSISENTIYFESTRTIDNKNKVYKNPAGGLPYIYFDTLK